MLLQVEHGKHRVRVLLDTGCSVPLVNKETAWRLQIPMLKHDSTIRIENYTGQQVKEAGIFYTKPLLLQHRRHFSKAIFEVTPMEPEVDIFLPYWWISKYSLQGIWKSEEIWFNSTGCQETCTRYEQKEFSLTWDERVAHDPNTRVIGHISAVTTDDVLARVPGEFRPYQSIMSQEEADALPQHRPYDCKIELKEGSTAPWGPIYPLSEVEQQTLREWLKDMERTGKIKQLTSPAGSPILFVPKPHGRGLRLCVDYRALNQITIPNRYPLPLMQELQDRVLGAHWFTKMDLKNGFHLIRMRRGDEWKTAFRTRYGLFEFQVMPFGLTNVPSTFQDMMNHVLSDLLDVGVLAYMDDILVYAKTEKEHH